MKRSSPLRIVVWSGMVLVASLVPASVSGQAVSQAGPPVRGSWTSDRLPLQVGDVVTILIDELTQVSADRNESASREKDRDVGVSLGTGGTTSGGNLRANNDVGNRNRGESTRRERFSAEMTTRVVEVGPGGTLKVQGTKRVKIDEHEQEVTVSGWIRSQDVAVDNTVLSWRVADAEISYTSNGSLVKAGGIWSKLLDIIVP